VFLHNLLTQLHVIGIAATRWAAAAAIDCIMGILSILPFGKREAAKMPMLARGHLVASGRVS
jgi:hypothetical protein